MNTQKAHIRIAIQTLLLLAVLVFLNLIGSRLFFRMDLTEDKRYTVSDAAVELTRSLPEPAFVTVYYSGEMPAYYKNLEEDIRVYLEELSSRSGGNLDYQFFDPSGDTATFNRFMRAGFGPFPLSANVSSTQKEDVLVLPYAEISYKGRMKIVNLIKGCVFRGPRGRLDVDVTKARSNIEYNLLSEMYNLSREKFKTLGLLTGHGEYTKEAMTDLYKEMDAYYNILQVDLRNGRPITPADLDVLLVMQPHRRISEREKFEMDQYLLRGGRIIFCMDQEMIDFSIGEQASTLTDLRQTNMDDFFTKRGLKLNYDIVTDARCGSIDASQYTQSFGSNMSIKPWPFHPVIFEFPPSPITRSLKDVLIRYGSSIDTFYVPEIRKEVLLMSSPETNVRSGRQFINLNQELATRPDPRDYRDGRKMFGVLATGRFESLFATRSVPVDSTAQHGAYLPVLKYSPDTAAAGQIALISDGEFATGEIVQGRLMSLPSDNRDFMMNLIDQFSGQEIRSHLREREIIPRQLYYKSYQDSTTFWQMLNVGAPVLCILVYGVFRAWRRKRRNQGSHTAQSE